MKRYWKCPRCDTENEFVLTEVREVRTMELREEQDFCKNCGFEHGCNVKIKVRRHIQGCQAYLAGFALAGKRTEEGRLKSYSDSTRLLEEFPDEVEIAGQVFTLETIEKGKDGYECAEYV